MEELFDQQHTLSFPVEQQQSGQFGQSWEEISLNVNRALKGHISPSSSQDTLCSRTRPACAPSPPSKSKSGAKKKLPSRQENALAAGPPLRLKLERSSTEQENVTSCQQLLTKRSLSEFKSLSSPDAAKTEENAQSAFRALQTPDSSLLSNTNFQLPAQHRQKISLQKESEELEKDQQTAEGGCFELQKGRERLGEIVRESKSQSSLLMVPAKVDIFIRYKHHSESKSVEKNTGGVFYRKASHLQQYSHLRTNNHALPCLNQPPSEQPQHDSIHATDNKQRWQFVRLSLSKSGKELRTRQKELQLGLQRQLMQASKGNPFRTPKNRLKLT